MDALKLRRSVRKFDKSRKIDYDTLVELCRIGESAPAARNQKGREYVIIDDESIINELATLFLASPKKTSFLSQTSPNSSNIVIISASICVG